MATTQEPLPPIARQNGRPESSSSNGSGSTRLPRIGQGSSVTQLSDDEAALEARLASIDERMAQRRQEYAFLQQQRDEQQARKEREIADKRLREWEQRARENEDARLQREYQQRRAEREKHRQFLEQQKHQLMNEDSSEEVLAHLKNRYKTLLSPRSPQGPNSGNPRGRSHGTTQNGSMTARPAAQDTPQGSPIAAKAPAAPVEAFRENGRPKPVVTAAFDNKESREACECDVPPAAVEVAAPTPAAAPEEDNDSGSPTSPPEDDDDDNNTGTGFGDWTAHANFRASLLDDENSRAQVAEAAQGAIDRRRSTRRVGVSAKVHDQDEDFEDVIVPKSPTTMQALEKVLRLNPLMANLELEDLAVIARAMSKREYSAGDVILHKGDENDEFFIIADGEVVIGEEVISSGKSFGELELMYSSPVGQEVKCKTNVNAWVLDGMTYRRSIGKTHQEKRKLYEELLQNVDLLKAMSKSELLTLADALQPAYYKEGENLISFGEVGEWMHIILDGTVEVWGRDPSGATMNVCTFGRGDPVGELEFINHHKCVADVVAKTDVKTVKLNRAHFEMCMGPITDLLLGRTQTQTYNYYSTFDWTGIALFNEEDKAEANDEEDNDAGFEPHVPDRRDHRGSVVRRRVAVSSTIAGETAVEDYEAELHDKPAEDHAFLKELLPQKLKTLFSHLDGETMDSIIGAMKPVRYSDAQNVITAGSEDDHMYVITEGKARANNGQQLERGSIIAEEQLMYSTPNSTTIVCDGDVLCYALQRSVYQHTVAKVSKQRRELYEGLLQGVDFLQGMSRVELLQLADALQPAEFKPNDLIIAFGSEGEWMHIILEGEVEVWGRDNEGTTINVCEFSQGDPIGELEFINKHTCVADVVAKTDVKTVKLNRNHFELCMGPVADVLKNRTQTNTYSYYTGFNFGSETDDAFHRRLEGDELPSPRSVERRESFKRRTGVSSQQDAEEEGEEEFTPQQFYKTEEDKAFIRNCLNGRTLFAKVEEKDIDTLILAMEPQGFQLTENIIAAGETNDKFHIVVEGECSEYSSDGAVKAVYARGDVFGELDLMYKTETSTSIAATTAQCRTFSLDRQTFRAVVVKGSHERRKLYKELLGHVSFLESMSQQELLNLADALQPSNYKPGEPLIKHGEENEWMHIIMEGEVEVIGRDDFNKPVHVCTFGRGQPIGELEFINKHKAVADVVAKDNVTTVRVNRRHFELVMGPCIEFLRQNAKQPVYTYYAGKLENIRNAH